MPTVVGIDENGFGPVLGPLVATATVFDVDGDYRPDLFWEELGSVASRSRADFPDKLPVLDSKEIFAGKDGRGRRILEEVVLAFMSANGSGGRPTGTSEVHSRLILYPRYCYESSRLPLCVPENRTVPFWDGDKIFGAHGKLRRALEDSRVRIRDIRTAVMCPGEFNRLLDRHGSKFYVDWVQFERLIEWVLKGARNGEATIICGKIGSQKDYLDYLEQGPLGRFQVEEIERGSDLSAYRLSGEGRPFEIHFVKEAEGCHFPVALASIIGKYVREIYVSHQNEFFQRQAPGLKSVSGYREPLTKEFISQTEELRRDLSVPDRCFIRRK